MFGSVLACMLAIPALSAAQDPRAPLIGPFFALAEDGDLLASAIAPTPGEYTLAVDNLGNWLSRGWADDMLAERVVAQASAENGLSLHWRVELPEFVPHEFELRVLDPQQVPIWKHTTFDLPDAGWAEVKPQVCCLGPCAENWTSGLLIASIDACDAAPAWRAAAKRRPDWLLVLDDLSSLAPGDLDQARAHYRDLYRDADLLHPWGMTQLFNLPSFGALSPRRDALAALRQAYSEHHPLAVEDSLWSTQSPGLRSGELELILVDPSAVLASNSLDAALGRLALSSAPFKLVMRPGRWFDARSAERELWDDLLGWLAFHRVFGVVLLGSDPHVSGVVEHATCAQLGYDLLEVVCGPANETHDPTRALPDPSFMPGSVLEAALVRIQARGFQLRITLEDLLGPTRFPVERSSTWLRPR